MTGTSNRRGQHTQEFGDYGGSRGRPDSGLAHVVVPVAVTNRTAVSLRHATDGDVRPGLPALEVLQLEECDLIRRVWGPAMLDDVRKVRAIVRIREVLREETGRMLRSATIIGRSVNDLRQELSQPDFERAMRFSRDVFPGWSKANLSKMVSVAKFVDDSKTPFDALPQSYSVLYEFTTMDVADFELAKETGLFGPAVTRSAVQVFKRHLDQKRRANAAGAQPPNASAIREVDERLRVLLAEARELRRKRARLAAEDKDWLAAHTGSKRRRQDAASPSSKRTRDRPADGENNQDGEGRPP